MELHRGAMHEWRSRTFFVILRSAPSITSQNTFAAASGDRRGTSREKRTCKRDQGAGKPEKFIKRFLSRHRRTSVSDLLAPASDPACPQGDSLGSSFGRRQSMALYAGVQSSLGTPTSDITLFLLDIPRNFQARRFRVPHLSTSIQSTDGTHPRLPSREFPFRSLSLAKD